MVSSVNLVSIYMTVKNGSSHIKDAIESIKQQSYTHWEAIIVDDGSFDSTPEFLEWLAQSDSRFKVFITRGMGRAPALNFALSHATGVYVANLDADDVFHPRKLEYQIALFERHQHVEFICTEGFLFEKVYQFSKIDSSDLLVCDITDSMKIRNGIIHSSVMFKRSLLDRFGFYCELRAMQVDLDLWYRFILQNLRVYKLPMPLAGKRIHELQSFENKKRLRYIYSSYLLRLKYLRLAQAGYKYYIISAAVLVAGALPIRVRAILRRLLFSDKI